MKPSQTPITDLITEMLKNCIPIEMILVAVRSMELALSTRIQVDVTAENRREWDREYRRERRKRPPDSTRHPPDPPDNANVALSLEEKKEGYSKEVSKKEKKERGQKLPPDWKAKIDHYEEGLKRGLARARIDELADNMRTWATANANRSVTTKADWDATFMGFIRRERANGNGHHNSPRRSANSDFFAGIASVAADIVGNDQPSRDDAPDVPLGRFNIEG